MHRRRARAAPALDHGWITIALRIAAAAGLGFLLLPGLIVFPLALEPGEVLRFPPQGVSSRWFREYLSSPLWRGSLVLSFGIALCAAGLATAIGTAAALGLARACGRTRKVYLIIVLCPLFLPTIVVAVAVYGVFSSLGLVDTVPGLIIAHAVLATPFVVLCVSISVARIPPVMNDAAKSLGATPTGTFIQVTGPLIRGGIAAGAIFAFLISFGEAVIARFVAGTRVVTLPARMFDSMFFDVTPLLAAVSATLIVLGLLLAAGAFVYLRLTTPGGE